MHILTSAHRAVRQFTQAQAKLQVRRLFISNEFTIMRYDSLRFFLKNMQATNISDNKWQSVP